jgi:hypothetical protein
VEEKKMKENEESPSVRPELTLRKLAKNSDNKKKEVEKDKNAKTTPSISKKKTKKWYRQKEVDTKNSISLSDTKDDKIDEIDQKLSEIENQNKFLYEENNKLRLEMLMKMQEVDNIKQSFLSNIQNMKEDKSAKSIQPQKLDRITPDYSNPSNDLKTAQPNVSWNTLVNIFKSREQQIPTQPQPITLRNPDRSPRRHTPKTKEKRMNYVKGIKNEHSDSFYKNGFSEEEEYEIIEEDEESEEENSGVIYHF